MRLLLLLVIFGALLLLAWPWVVRQIGKFSKVQDRLKKECLEDEHRKFSEGVGGKVQEIRESSEIPRRSEISPGNDFPSRPQDFPADKN